MVLAASPDATPSFAVYGGQARAQPDGAGAGNRTSGVWESAGSSSLALDPTAADLDGDGDTELLPGACRYHGWRGGFVVVAP